MSITPSKLYKHARARLWRGVLWFVYQFNPGLYWTMRSRKLHERWFAEDSDHPIYRDMLNDIGAHTCLEIGCNGGRLSRLLVNHVEKLECQDISAKAIAICKTSIPTDKLSRVTFRCGSIISLYSASAAQFDITVSNSVLSAVKPHDIRMTVQTLAKVSKHIIVSELWPGDPGAAYYWFAHDYDRLFAETGMQFVREVVSGDQRFRLYSHYS
jgi:SAM-dependent methyltransferase